MLIEQLRIVV